MPTYALIENVVTKETHRRKGYGKNWDTFNWSYFASNPAQPPTFITYFGLIITCIGFVGFITAYIQNTGYFKIPRIVFMSGSGIFVAGLTANILIHVKERKT
jgi:hypothetical protein